MQVPFVSSGAVSRAHYSLVRNVEANPQSANEYVSAQIKTIRRQFSQSTPAFEDCKECLIILLYCLTIVDGSTPLHAFDFALPHAIGLAEAGPKMEQKRIGYLYCSEVMHQNHELLLMLVNTLRKDLEHDNVARVCLALDVIVKLPNKDLVPAVQDRIYRNLSHASPLVRRRAMIAFRVLFGLDDGLSVTFNEKITEILKDPEPATIRMALVAYSRSEDVKAMLNGYFKERCVTYLECERAFYFAILHALGDVGLMDDNLSLILNFIRNFSESKDNSMLRGAFQVLSKVAPASLSSLLHAEGNSSPIEDIRPLLVSSDPNDIYTFLSCLESLDPCIWAGTSTDIPLALEGWEVEHIMRLLESQDSLIRRMTLQILNQVDSNIIASYKSRALETIPHNLHIKDCSECAVRILEASMIQAAQDGDLYARDVRDVLVHLDDTSGSDLPVLETVVENVILRIRYANPQFRLASVTSFVSDTAQLGSHLPQTFLVITAALAVEFCGHLDILAADSLKGFASRLSSCLPSVQDACILAMLRIAADCSDVPPEIVMAVAEVKEQSCRYIRKRCDQFFSLTNERAVLSNVIAKAKSPTLPDFFLAIQNYETEGMKSSFSDTTSLSPSSHQILADSKELRYKAYDPPASKSQVRMRRKMGTHPESFNKAKSKSSPDTPSPALIPGQLTLAAVSEEGSESRNKRSPGLEPNSLNPNDPVMDDIECHVDLISLDSPFGSNLQGREFEEFWNSNEDGEVRGWQSLSVNNVVLVLEKANLGQLEMIAADKFPFFGDLKLFVWSKQRVTGGAVRLRPSEEQSCLWRVRGYEKEFIDELRIVLGA